MSKPLILALYGYLVAGAGHHDLTPPYTCTTTTTLCQPEDSRDSHHSVGPVSSPEYGRPGKRGLRGPKGEKGDSCGCGDGEESGNLPLLPVSQPITVKGDKGEPGRPAPTNETELEEMRRRIEQLETKVTEAQSSTSSNPTRSRDISSSLLSKFPTSCSDLKQRGVSDLERATIYPMISFHDITPYVVNCTDGGWITIQRRVDGSVNFHRTWREYADGFGDKDGEFWLGLENIHRLTSQRAHELHIDMKKRSDGASMYARYGVFFVDSERSKFRLVVGDYSGNYGDRLSNHNGLRFSTYDEDLDETTSTNCAQAYKGGWWYKACYDSNLNGQYSGSYFYWTGLLSSVEMKIRPRC